MKREKLLRVLRSLFWSLIGVFVGRSIYIIYDYWAHPGLYAMRPAPWYYDIVQIAAVTAVAALGIRIVMWAVGRWGGRGRD